MALFITNNQDGLRGANTCSPQEDPLTSEETDLLHDCAADLRRYERAGLDAGRALRTIRDGRLYRETHGTYEAYVEDTCSFDLRRAQQLVAAADVVDGLAETGLDDLPRNEAQARPLAPLGADDQAAVWAEAVRRHGGARNVSKAKVRAVVGELFPAPQTESAGTQGALAGPVPVSADGAPPWGDEVHEALDAVPAVDRDAVREALASAPDAVTREAVREAAAVAAAERAEDGGRSGRPVVLGAAGAVVAADRRRLTGGPARTVVEDLVVLPDAPDGYVPDGGYVPGPNVPSSPLLVVVPVGLVPDSLLDAHDGAREALAGRAEAVVLLSELEAHGGPVEDGVLDVAAVREAAREAGVTKRFNKTGKLVGWAHYSTNPITGCSHACSRQFCYASDLALAYYSQGFAPTVHPARLDAFAATALPDPDRSPEWAREWGRSVFLGSMGDLMNGAFPDWWVEAVVDEVRAHPDWSVFVLTKLAGRLGDFDWPSNALVGVTVTDQRGVRAAAAGLASVEGDVRKWVSVEPFLGPIDPAPLLDAGATFFAVGGRSRTRWSGEAQPDPTWVRDLVSKAWARGASVYAKDNLDWRGHIPYPGVSPFAAPPGAAPPPAAPGPRLRATGPRSAGPSAPAVPARRPPPKPAPDSPTPPTRSPPEPPRPHGPPEPFHPHGPPEPHHRPALLQPARLGRAQPLRPHRGPLHHAPRGRLFQGGPPAQRRDALGRASQTRAPPPLDASVAAAAPGTLVVVWEFAPRRVVWAPVAGRVSSAVRAVAQQLRGHRSRN